MCLFLKILAKSIYCLCQLCLQRSCCSVNSFTNFFFFLRKKFQSANLDLKQCPHFVFFKCITQGQWIVTAKCFLSTLSRSCNFHDHHISGTCPSLLFGARQAEGLQLSFQEVKNAKEFVKVRVSPSVRLYHCVLVNFFGFFLLEVLFTCRKLAPTSCAVGIIMLVSY